MPAAYVRGAENSAMKSDPMPQQPVSTVQTDPSSTAISTLTWRLLPFLFLLYIVAYLDRINVGFAALQMQRQLHFNDSVYGLGAGIFFAGYLLFQVPSNLALQRVGARRWICLLMITWGVISASTAFISTPRSFYFLRFLLGSAEAGFFPGIILYLRNWFPSSVRARTVALFMCAGPLSGVVGGPISGMLLNFHGRAALAGWQWLFLIEGLPAIILGIVVFIYLADTPQDARWLTSVQRTWLTGALDQEKIASRSSAPTGTYAAFKSGSVWLLALAMFGITTCTSGISLWLPTLIRSVSTRGNLTIGLLSAIPYVAAAIAEILVGLHSDRSGERRWHVAVPAFTGAIAIISAAYLTSLAAILVAISIALLSAYATFGPFWAMATTLLDRNAAAAGIAVINAVGNLGGFWGPYAIGAIRNYTGTFRGGFLVAAFAITICGFVVVLVRLQPSPPPLSVAGGDTPFAVTTHHAAR
jgi:MFS transporter, ACS family, tartrate transporter